MRRLALAAMLLLATIACADLRAEVEGAKTEQALKNVLGSHQNDPLAQEALRDLNLRNFGDVKSDLVSTLTAREKFTTGGLGATPDTNNGAATEAAEIKSSPLYRDASDKKTESWLSQAVEQFRKWLESLFKTPEPGAELPLFAVPWLTQLVWALIALAVLGLLIFAFMQVRRLSSRRAVKAGGLLSEDEPDLTSDEWLEKADSLLAQKRFREATRALYIATLMRFDQHAVVRFNRYGTNWEHLGRIEASPKYPGQCDFRSATRLFDRVWYGFLDNDEHSVQSMRSHYLTARDALAGQDR